MGYTHYWRIDKKINKKEIENVAYDMQLIEQHLKDVQLGGWDGETKGVQYDIVKQGNSMNVMGFRFNGYKDGSHETFSLNLGDDGFNFCKTGQKPYDTAACMVLLSLKFHAPHVELSSDGDDDDWSEAKKEYENLFQNR